MTLISSLPPAVQDKVKKYIQKWLNESILPKGTINDFSWRKSSQGEAFWEHVADEGWLSAAEKFPDIAATFEQATTLNMRLVQELREGKVAVDNNGNMRNIDQLQMVLDRMVNTGSFKYYWFDGSRLLCSDIAPSLSIISLADFFRPDAAEPANHITILHEEKIEIDPDNVVKPWQPQRGEMVEVSNDKLNWASREYIATIDNSEYPVITALRDDEGVSICEWKYIRPISTITLTQIAEKFGIPEDQVRIEGFTKNQK